MTAIEVLRRLGVQIVPGLTDEEFQRIETIFAFRFGDDHRAMLHAGLPIGDRWVDWRNGSESDLRTRLAAPIDAIMSDVDDGLGWSERWGPRPAGVDEAHEIALAETARWTSLVPVYGHRFTAAAPSATGAPVLSVHGWDVALMGVDLLDYLAHEFGPRRGQRPEHIPPVLPWTERTL